MDDVAWRVMSTRPYAAGAPRLEVLGVGGSVFGERISGGGSGGDGDAEGGGDGGDGGGVDDGGRGLHSFTFRLNVSTFCGLRWGLGFPQSK